MSGRLSVTPAARLTRGWLCAALSTFLAGASHAIAGGSVPLLPVALAMVFGTLICVTLAGRQLTLPRVVLGVAMSQLVFHSLFSAFTGTAASMVGAPVVHGHGSVAAHPVPGIAAAGADDLGLLMLLSHMIAGLVTVFLVRHGEALWWALVGALSASLSALTQVVAASATPGPRSMPDRPAVPGLNDLLLADARQHLRGPPNGGLIIA